MSISVAIIGSGPAGLYAADGLLRKAPGIRIDIFERLPTPFGLVRYGVAPDHQGTKNIARVLERTIGREGVRFLGNIEIGKDISLDELRNAYDAVIVAFGCPIDRQLGIPGEDKANVYGSWKFVGWYNSHPDFEFLSPDLNVRSAIIIGNGNVAIDVARVLAKTPAELATSDITLQAAALIGASSLTDIHIVGRRGAVDASFTNPELAELGKLERCVPLVCANDLTLAASGELPQDSGKASVLATLEEFSANDPTSRPIRIHFHFNLQPIAVLGGDQAETVRFERTGPSVDNPSVRESSVDIPGQLVVTCIGYKTRTMSGLPMNDSRGIVANREGHVDQGLYVVGWAKRGPSGTIATNRPDSMAVAQRIIDDLAGATRKPPPEKVDFLLSRKELRPVSFADWQQINGAEIAAGMPPDGPPRRKFTSVKNMLAAIG